MKLSIVTINYNDADGLKRTIDSVISQTFRDYEWIVVDGGSSDGSRELIEQKSTFFTYWVSETDQGIYNAMNKGIDHANGEWILFLNSGDWLYADDVLDRVFSKEYSSDVLYGDVMYHWPDARGMELEQKPDNISLYYFYEHTLCHQSTFYKKDIFANHRYNEDYKICSDWALFIRLIIEGYTFEHLSFCISNFDQSGISSRLTSEHSTERNLVISENIPPHIIPDIMELHKQELHCVFINSHKLFQTIMTHAEVRIKRMYKLIKFVEKIRNKSR